MIALLPPGSCKGGANCSRACISVVTEDIHKLCEALGHTYYIFTYQKKGSREDDTDGFYGTNFPDEYFQALVTQKYVADPVTRFVSMGGVPGDIEFDHGSWEAAYELALANPLGETPTEQTEYQEIVRVGHHLSSQAGLVSGVFMTRQNVECIITISLGSSLATEEHAKLITPALWANLRYGLLLLFDNSEHISQCAYCDHGRVAGHIEAKRISPLSKKLQRVLQAILHNPRITTQAQLADELNLSVPTIKAHLIKIRKLLELPSRMEGRAVAEYAKDNSFI